VDDAMELYLSALAIDPDSVFARFNLGNALLSKGQYEEARVHYEWALAIEPNLLPARQALSGMRGR